MQWYVYENDQQTGPFDEAALAGMVQRGQVTPQTMVWSPGMADWKPYSEIVAGQGASMGAPAAASAAQAAAPSVLAGVACRECGREYPPEEMVQYGGEFVCAQCKPVFFQRIKEGVPMTGEMRYAGFWIRFCAKFIDGFVMGLLMVPLGMLWGLSSVQNMPNVENSTFVQIMMAFSGVGTPIWFIGMAIQICYFVGLHGSRGQTLGKMAMRVKVVRPDGSKISYPQAFGRYCISDLIGAVPLIGSIIQLVGYLMAGFDSQKRALHDRVAGTRVVYKESK